MIQAGDMCPAPPKHTAAAGVPISEDDHLIHIDSDDAMVDAEGHAAVNGRVTVRQDARTVAADSMNYDYKSGKLSVKGGVDFEDPKIRIKSDKTRIFLSLANQCVGVRDDELLRCLEWNDSGTLNSKTANLTNPCFGNE